MEYSTTASEQEKEPKPECLNCGAKMPRHAKFCPQCAQKKSNGKHSMMEFLQRFFVNLTHLNAKLLKNFNHLMTPGKLTEAYFAGKHKQFPHPVQYFFISMFFLLVSYNYFSQKRPSGMESQGVTFSTVTSDNKVVKKGYGADDFYPILKEIAMTKKIRMYWDSLPASLQTPEAALAMDTILDRCTEPYKELMSILGTNSSTSKGASVAASSHRNKLQQLEGKFGERTDTINLTVGNRAHKFALLDVLEKSPEQLVDAYAIEGTFNRVLVRQSLKTLIHPGELVKFYLGSFTWTLLALVAFMAAIFYIFYKRKGKFYVEHFVFLLHVVCASNFIIMLGLLLTRWLGMREPVIISLFLTQVFLLIAMHRYYGERWLVCFGKWILFSFLFLIFGVVFFIFGLFFALALF